MIPDGAERPIFQGVERQKPCYFGASAQWLVWNNEMESLSNLCWWCSSWSALKYNQLGVPGYPSFRRSHISVDDLEKQSLSWRHCRYWTSTTGNWRVSREISRDLRTSALNTPQNSGHCKWRNQWFWGIEFVKRPAVSLKRCTWQISGISSHLLQGPAVEFQ